MKQVEKVLAHHAGAKFYHQETGRYPSPEELARFVNQDGVKEEIAAYGAAGDRDTAAAVLSQIKLQDLNLGEVYQLLRGQEEKKGLGQVFTPANAVDATLELVLEASPDRIIDPACGAGDFLLAAARAWPKARLTGVDIDPLALAVARTRLALANNNTQESTSAQFIHGNALALTPAGDYDLVLGNPPWGSKISAQEIRGYSIAGKKLLNSFVYFLELAARLLKPGGQLAYVLPEAFIKVWIYQEVRAWLLRNFALTGLHYIPNLFRGYYAPAVLAAAVRLPAPRPDRIPVWYQHSLKDAKVRYNTLQPSAINSERFNVNWNPALEEMWELCCRNSVFLQEAELGTPLPPGQAVVDFSLGIVTGNNRRFLSSRPLSPEHLPVLQARDVTPLKTAQSSLWMRYDAEDLQQAAPLAKYQAPAKIVYRFIAREITAAVDYSGALTVNNLNIILPLRLPFALDYLAALLNSRLLNTLYMYRFFTGKVLTRNLKQLPLRAGTAREQEAIIEAAQALAQGEDTMEQLNNLVYAVYNLSPDQQTQVEEQYRTLKKIFFV